jgi:hypothetical protein
MFSLAVAYQGLLAAHRQAQQVQHTQVLLQVLL